MNKSRNQREGYYAGHYPHHAIFGKGGHKRWSAWAMCEFYPKVNRTYPLTDEDFIKETGRPADYDWLTYLKGCSWT